jgi:hypothetical protein
MKTISAFTETAIDNPHVDVIRLVEITIGSITLYLCDRVFGDDNLCEFNSQLYEPLIMSWGTIKCGRIDPVTYAVEPGAADFTVDNSQPVGGADCFSVLFAADDPQYCSVIISEIHAGASASADKENIFAGHIEDLPEMTVDRVSVACGGFELDVVNRFAHTIVDDTTYPGADPDDIGKMVPQFYGAVKRVPCIAADAGGKTTIAEDMTDTSPGNSGTLAVSDASAFPSSGAFTIQIDAEQVRIASRSGNTLTLASSGARGYDSTTAVDHDLGAPMAEIQTAYVYLLADHPVKTISTVYVDDIRQTTGFTAYTGQSGDEYSGYSGKAVIVFSALPNYKKQVNIEADSSSLDTADAGHEHAQAQTTIEWEFDYTTVSNASVNNPNNICDQNKTSLAQFDGLGDGTAVLTVSKSVDQSYSGPPESVRICMKVGTIQAACSVKAIFYNDTSIGVNATPADNGTTKYGNWNATTAGNDTWAELKALSMTVTLTGYNQATIYEVWLEVKYTPEDTDTGTADVSISGDVTLSGNSTAETVIGKRISVDAEGFMDDGSGTYTGTPNALIDRPDHQSKHIIIDRCGLSTDEINAAAYTAAGTFFNSNSFTLGFAILQRPNARLLLNRIATQAKALEFWEAGEHHISPIETSPSVDKVIDDNRVDLAQIWLKYTDRIHIKNKLTASYSRQWSGHIDDVEADQAIVIASDAGSITTFGTLQGDPLSYPYINGETQAQAVLDWKLADSKSPRLIVEHAGGYYLTDIERGDILRFDNMEYIEELITIGYMVTLGGDNLATLGGDRLVWQLTTDVDPGEHLKAALLGLVTMGTTLFRVIDKNYRPDATIQVEAVKI